MFALVSLSSILRRLILCMSSVGRAGSGSLGPYEIFLGLFEPSRAGLFSTLVYRVQYPRSPKDGPFGTTLAGYRWPPSLKFHRGATCVRGHTEPLRR